MKSPLVSIGYGVIAVLIIALTLVGLTIYFSAFGDYPRTLERILIGFSMFVVGMWLLLHGVKGRLLKVTRMTVGVLLIGVSVALLIMGLFGGVLSGTGMSVFVGVIVIVAGGAVGQLAMCCFNSKYTDDLAKRDMRAMKADMA